MTDTLRHTVPVPLPRTQESGVAPVHGTGGSATPQTAAPAGIPYRTAMQVCPRHPGGLARSTDSPGTIPDGQYGKYGRRRHARRRQCCGRRISVPPLRRPVPGAAGNALARRPGRGGLRHGIRAGSAAADIFRPGGVAHRKSLFSRVSCCCWPQPMPCSSTAIWRMCACC